MKKEYFAASLILLAFFSGMLLTAATSGCDARDPKVTAKSALSAKLSEDTVAQ